MDSIYTDFSKAFDKCDHGILLHKLKRMKINGKLGRWVQNFLKSRQQIILVEKVKSNKSIIVSGITIYSGLFFLSDALGEIAKLVFFIIIFISYLRIANITIRAIRRRMMGMMIPTRKVVLSGSVVISADHLDSLNISLVVYALILNLQAQNTCLNDL